MLSGWACGARARLAGVGRDSTPVTCSTPASGSRSPSSVASRMYGALASTRSPVGPSKQHRPDPVAVHVGRHGPVPVPDRQPAGREIGPHQRREHRGGDPWLVAEPAYPALPGVEFPASAAGRVGERIPGAVVVADRLAERAVRTGRAELLDPRVLVGGHTLAGQLAAEPVGLLRQQDAATAPEHSQRRRDAAEPTADDQHVDRLRAGPTGAPLPRDAGGLTGGPDRVRGHQRPHLRRGLILAGRSEVFATSHAIPLFRFIGTPP